MKTQRPSPQVVPFKLNPATGQVEYTVEGLKLFRAIFDDLVDHEDRIEALEP